jgi:hypothetical protein
MSESEVDRQAQQQLELVPRSVRDKLDRVGIKLHLKEWQMLSLADRECLRDLPCNNDAEAADYAKFVDTLIVVATGRPPDRLPPK